MPEERFELLAKNYETEQAELKGQSGKIENKFADGRGNRK